MNVVPYEFECPITRDIMKDPVVGSDGHTYDRAAIEEWLARDGKSPVTRNYMAAGGLVTNYALKSQIDRFLAAHPQTPLTPKPFVPLPVTIEAKYDNGSLLLSARAETATGSGGRQPIVMLLALDNSGSMAELASVDTNETGGQAFTRMDLCKHTIRTVAGMLKEADILGLVSFSTSSRIVLRPTPMTAEGKAKLETALATVKPDSQTNIWAGLESIHRMAAAAEFANSHIVCALLTDGLPNINPPRGIVETFKPLKKNYTMSTFGFGYNLDSNLLEGIATEGGGSFGFIPDYSMVATVFINWAATALSTAAQNQTATVVLEDDSVLKVQTGPIQVGVPRNILTKTYKAVKSVTGGVAVTSTPLPEFVLARQEILDGIRLGILGMPAPFDTLYGRFAGTMDSNLLEVLKDIRPRMGDDEGQVHMAPRYYDKWGKHYMRAYLRAQNLEQCMNFKDYGLQIYGGDLFHAVQAEGEAVFSSIPALEPTGQISAAAYMGGGATATATPATTTTAGVAVAPTMATYFYNHSGGCFAPNSLIRMADGSERLIQLLRKGSQVSTPSGPATVRALVVCHTITPTQLCLYGSLRITPWHPIQVEGEWTFPANLPQTVHEHSSTTVYNVVLESTHMLYVNGVICVTLAHGIKGSVVEHEFFGTDAILKDLKKVEGWEIGHVVYQNLTTSRDPSTGRIVGWCDQM